MNVIRKYHASWIEAAERGEISWETASMLMEAFELGIAEEGIKIKNDSFQYIRNIGKEVSYPPSGIHHKHRVDEIEKELTSTINFGSRRLHAELGK